MERQDSVELERSESALVAPRAVAEVESPEVERPGDERAEEGRWLRVLIVDAEAERAARLQAQLATEVGSGGSINVAGSAAEAMGVLVQEAVDAVLVRHELPGLDAVRLVEAIRVAGAETVVVVVAEEDEARRSSLEAGADDVCEPAVASSAGWLARRLVRLVEWRRLAREHARLVAEERRQVEKEAQEAEMLVRERRGMVAKLGGRRQLENDPGSEIVERETAGEEDQGRSGAAGAAAHVSAEFVEEYAQLLRQWVVMGAESVREEVHVLAGRLVRAGRLGAELLEVHVSAVEELLDGVAGRGARHVVGRADLLILELLVHLRDQGLRVTGAGVGVQGSGFRNQAAGETALGSGISEGGGADEEEVGIWLQRAAVRRGRW